jgi:hypothetical protein
MRPVLIGGCLGLLALALGCNPFVRDNKDADVNKAVRWGGGRPKPEQLVAYLNQNAQPVRSIEAQKLFMSAKQNNEHVGGLEGFLACQKAARPGTPPNFRLQAEVFGTPEVDIGSNGDEFWYWIKRAPQPYVFHCTYADYPKVAAGGRTPFPFQPEWVVEALGMSEYDPKAKYEVNESKTTYDLVQRVPSPKGGELVKVVAFHKEPRAGASQVAAYILYEPTNDPKQRYREVCSAVITDSQVVTGEGGKRVVLPSKVRLSCPDEKMTLEMELGKVQVNVAFDRQRSGVLFTRETLNRYKSYDLARGPDVPASEVRPAGGVMPPR